MVFKSRFLWTLVLADLLLLSASHPAVKTLQLPTRHGHPSLRRQPIVKKAERMKTGLGLRTTRSLTPELLSSLGDDLERAKSQNRNIPDIHDVAGDSSPLPKEEHRNFTLDACAHTDHCEGIRKCIWVSETDFGLCENDPKQDMCWCFAMTPELQICETSKDCVQEEFCALLTDINDPFCVSRTYLQFPDDFTPMDPPPPEDGDPKPDPESAPESATKEEPQFSNVPDSSSCVDAQALDHLPREDLILDKHATAHVLCDSNGSCATPGHVVAFDQKPMMMRTYCSIVGCERKVMAVNSPRYRRALRVVSRTKRLEYTPFAARYETAVEEALIKLAIHAGI